jgi:4-hydroxy-tetrahydrodipicolinate synthase
MFIEKKYQGVVVPLITPLTEKFTLDHAAVEKIFEHIRSGACKPFILGTTGEASSLPQSLKQDYLRKAASIKESEDILYAGIGSNCLQDSIDLAKFAFDTGTDVVVATIPSYYPMSDDQIKTYFLRLADSIGGPLIIYNIPSTTHRSIPLAVIDELGMHENIVGVKDSERSEERIKESLRLWAARKDFSYFLGWAGKAAEAIWDGADGIVPSTANLFPGIYKDMWSDGRLGDREESKQLISDKLGAIYQGKRSLGDSLAALKVLMNCHSLCECHMMPPLQRLSPEEEKILIKDYEDYKS